MAKYTQEELDYAVAQARLESYKEWYELGRWHSEYIKNIPMITY